MTVPIVDSLFPRPPQLPLAIPEDLAPRLLRLHGDPFVWWMGQLLKYLLRPQPHLQQDLEKTKEKMGLKNPVVGYVQWMETPLCFTGSKSVLLIRNRYL